MISMRIDRIKPKKAQYTVELRNDEFEYQKYDDNEALFNNYNNEEERFSTNVNIDEYTEENKGNFSMQVTQTTLEGNINEGNSVNEKFEEEYDI